MSEALTEAKQRLDVTTAALEAAEQRALKAGETHTAAIERVVEARSELDAVHARVQAADLDDSSKSRAGFLRLTQELEAARARLEALQLRANGAEAASSAASEACEGPRREQEQAAQELLLVQVDGSDVELSRFFGRLEGEILGRLVKHGAIVDRSDQLAGREDARTRWRRAAGLAAALVAGRTDRLEFYRSFAETLNDLASHLRSVADQAQMVQSRDRYVNELVAAGRVTERSRP